MERVYINEKPVRYERDAEGGVWFLKEQISREEAAVFFDYAWRHQDKGAKFEDSRGRNYTLRYNYNGGDWYYILERRHDDSY